MDKILLCLHLCEHKGIERIFVDYHYNAPVNKIIREIPGVKYSVTRRSWHLPPVKETVLLLAEKMKDVARLDVKELREQLIVKKQLPPAKKSDTHKPEISLLCQANNEALARYIDTLILKSYSGSTIKTYRNEFFQFLKEIKNKPVHDLTPDHVRRYILYCINHYKISEATVNSRINAIKFYFEQVLGHEKILIELPRPKMPLQLPRFFNQDEIALIINEVDNIKHKAMLMLTYSSGLRVSEVVAIKAKNIDSKRMAILIEQSKGKKDRMVKLSPVLLVMLREYWKKYKPSKDGYLFAGQNKNEAYSTRSLQLVLAAAKKKAGILKPGSVHALRHSFATHLLDKGTDVTMIMKLLGHNDLKTTLRYLHVTNRDILGVVSPLDDLKLN